MKVKVYYLTSIEIEIEDTVIENYINREFNSDIESWSEYHERKLMLEDNVWKAVEKASGLSFCDYKDGEITGIYDENGNDLIVY